MENQLINFDILLKGANQGDSIPSNDGIDHFKPPKQLIVFCEQFLQKQGIICHHTEFGLACQATKSTIEQVFNCHLFFNASEMIPTWEFKTPPIYPEKIHNLISQITFAPSPDFF